MARAQPGSARDLVETIFGFGLIVLVLWVPAALQHILFPIALVVTLAVVLIGWRGEQGDGKDLGLGRRNLLRSLWILPVSTAVTVISVLLARRFGTLHPLYKGDFIHIAGYVAWTCYQQFLLQNYFMARLLRLIPNPASGVTLAGTLFAVAHLPNLSLATATLIWGVVSCSLFRRNRSILVLGLAQGLLGLGFAICVPDAMHHHLRVGLGYLLYHGT